MNVLSIFLLAAFFIILMPLHSALAMSCVEDRSFKQMDQDSDAVLEGRFLRYGLVKSSMREEVGRENFNFNKPVIYLLTTTYMVERAWKGVSKGQEVTTIFSWPIPKEAKNQFLEKVRADDKYKDKSGVVYMIDKVEIDQNEEDYALYKDFYYDGCKNEFKITPENTKVLQKIFPAAVQ